MRKVCSVAFATLLGIASATAQTYPSRHVTMIVPLAPGGSTDTHRRASWRKACGRTSASR